MNPHIYFDQFQWDFSAILTAWNRRFVWFQLNLQKKGLLKGNIHAHCYKVEFQNVRSGSQLAFTKSANNGGTPRVVHCI